MPSDDLRDGVHGCVVFMDMVGYSKLSDPAQRALAAGFMQAVGNVLSELYGQNPAPRPNEPYHVFTTGDGAGIILWKQASEVAQLDVPQSALWIAARVLQWADEYKVGVRCGINAGPLDELLDPERQSTWHGRAINESARIMDAAKAGQILASSDTYVSRLGEERGQAHDVLRFELSERTHEMAKHNLRLGVRAIRPRFNEAGAAAGIGCDVEEPPEDAWHRQMLPPQPDDKREGMLPAKELLEKGFFERVQEARRLAFVGANHPRLEDLLRNTFARRNGELWSEVEIYFLSASAMESIDHVESDLETELAKRTASIASLKQALPKMASRWSIREHGRPFFFASYLDWERQGSGFIHVSPYVWGSNISLCPAHDYVWTAAEPSKYFVAYRDGLDALRKLSTVIASD